MSDALVTAHALWKKFPRTQRAARRYARRTLWSQLTGRPNDALLDEEFWALSDFSLNLQRGEAVGVIGLNGSGKSTTLGLVAGYLQPERGVCRTQGKVAAFINLSSGLNMNLSGLDNIFLKGALDGRSRAEMRRSLDDITEFSGLGDFLHTPVGKYSTGMKMRLAFSIAIHTQPDVLLVDEVLSVGDFEFRQRCMERMQELRREAAVVLVTHSMNDVSRFCDRALVLDHGSMVFDGDVGDAIQIYRNAEQALATGGVSTSHIEQEYENAEALHVETAELTMQAEDPDAFLDAFDGFELHLTLVAKRAVRNLVVGVPIKRHNGDMITAVSSEGHCEQMSLEAGDRVHMHLSVEHLGLNPGRYSIVVGIVDGPEFLYRKVLHTVRIRSSSHQTWGNYTPSASWQSKVSSAS